MKRFNKLLSAILAIAMIFVMVPMSVFAEGEKFTYLGIEYDKTVVEDGYDYITVGGTKWQIITTYDELKAAVTTKGNYVLANDLDLSDTAINSAGKVTASEIEPANGTVIDGNNYSIYGFTLAGSDASKSHNGLFTLPSGTLTVQNLSFGKEDAWVSVADGIIARGMSVACNTTWKNVTVYTYLTRTGGFPSAFMSNVSNGTHIFTDCTVNAKYTGGALAAGSYLGAFIGQSSGANTSFSFTNCIANVDLKPTTVGAVGGLMGYSNVSSTTPFLIKNCTVTGELGVAGAGKVGGLIGEINSANNFMEITDCTVDATIAGATVGVAVGRNAQATAPITISNLSTTAEDISLVGSGVFYSVDDDTQQIAIPASVETIKLADPITYELVEWSVIREFADLPTVAVDNGRYIFANNIDCTGQTTAKVIKLGAGSIFNGNGYAMTNIYLTTDSDLEQRHDGLFDIACGEVITFKNLTFGSSEKRATVPDSIVSRNINVGNQNTVWVNVHAFVDLTRPTGNPAAFFSGVEYGTHIFADCTVDVTCDTEFIAASRLGGYVGSIGNNAKDVRLIFNNSTAKVDFKTTGSTINAASGFVGTVFTNQNVVINNCTATGAIDTTNVTNVGAFLGSVSGNVVISSDCTHTVVDQDQASLDFYYAIGTEAAVLNFAENAVQFGVDAETNPSGAKEVQTIADTVTIGDVEYTVLRTYDDLLNKMKNKAGSYILANDIDFGEQTISRIGVASGTLFESCGFRFLNLDLIASGTDTLFDFTGEGTIEFRNLTFGSLNAPAILGYSLIEYDIANHVTVNWNNVDVYALCTSSTGNIGAFYGGSISAGTHNFTNCNVYFFRDIGMTAQGNAAGAFLGRNKSATVNLTACKAYGAIAASDNAGGFIGKNDGTTTLTDCSNYATVSNHHYAYRDTSYLTKGNAGGLISYAATGQNGKLSIHNSENNASVYGYQYASGLVANNELVLTVNDSTNHADVYATQYAAGFISYASSKGTVDILSCQNNGVITGNTHAGGFVTEQLGALKINASINNGAINGNQYTGGFVATVSETTTEIDDSINNGTITSTSRATSGFVAHTAICTVTISNSENHGNAITSTSTTGYYASAGGFVGDFYGDVKLGLLNVTNYGNMIGAYPGGLAGRVGENGTSIATMVIKNSTNYGTIGSTAANQAAGLVVGNYGYIALHNCLNAGDVVSGTHAAGFARRVTNLVATNCTNLGNITSSSTSNTTQGVSSKSQPSGVTAGTITFENCYFFGTASTAANVMSINSSKNVTTSEGNSTTATATYDGLENIDQATADARFAARYYNVGTTDAPIYEWAAIKGVQETAVDANGRYKVRVVGIVDEGDALNDNDKVSVYDEVGFVVKTFVASTQIAEASRDLEYLFAEIQSGENTLSAADLGGTYIAAMPIVNVPTDRGEIMFVVTPYVTQTINGVQVTYDIGATVTATYTYDADTESITVSVEPGDLTITGTEPDTVVES